MVFGYSRFPVEKYPPRGTQRGYAATKFGMISRKSAKTQRKRNPIFRTSHPFDAAQDMLGVLAGGTPKSESESPLSEKFA
jgi:hypothetical protein